MAMMTGKEALIEILRSEGVDHVFGVPGSTEVLFLDALQDHPEIKYILGLHESVCVGIAEGYSRASGKVGVVNLHTTPGLASAMSMLLNAHGGGVPLVLIVGQQDTRLLLQEPVLTGDLKAIASQFTKWGTEVIYPADIPIALRRAFKVAAYPPTGPVLVSLPLDVVGQSLDFEYSPSTPFFPRLRPDQEAINRAVKLLAGAQNPIIILSSGVAKNEAVAEVVKLAELTGARVYQQWMADMNFPTSHLQYMGELSSSFADHSKLLQSVDVLIAIGLPLLQQLYYAPGSLLPPDIRVIQVDDNPWEISKNFPVAAGMHGDIKVSLAELNEALQKEMPAEACQAASARAKRIGTQTEETRQAFLKKVQEEWDNVPISVSRLMQELGNSLKPATVVVDDSWTCGMTLRNCIHFDKPRSYYRLRAGGSIGWALPASLGVKLALPNHPVVAVSGDGSAIFFNQSLWVAAHYNIPVTFVVCANASYRTVNLGGIRQLGERGRRRRLLGTGLDKPSINFSQLAQAMGVEGKKVERPEELKGILKWALELDKPALVEVIIDDAM